jgi:competence protein ComEC
LAIVFLLGLGQPLWLFQAGFQLSFAAVWAILVFYPPLYRLWPVKGRIGAYLGQLCCLGTAAQLGVLPLSLFYFHQMPLHFLLANLLLMPLLGLVLGWGFGVLLAAAAGHLPGWLATPYGYILESMNALALWLGRQNSLVLSEIPWGAVELCLGFGALLALAGYTRNQTRLWLGGVLSCLLALQGYTLWQGHRQAGRSEWVVPHRVATGGFWLRDGSRLTLYNTDPEAFARLAEAYQTGERLGETCSEPLQNSYTLGGRRLLVVDSAGVFKLPETGADLVLLTGSPRIHLGRLIEACRPERIVADGTNYSSFIKRWEQTCREYGVPLHATAKSGAFRMPIVQTD